MYVLITLILFYAITLILDSHKKKIDKLLGESECFHEMNELLHEYKIDSDKVIIEERKEFQYRPRDNSIGVRSFESTKYSDIIPALHEVGHYIEINKSERRFKILKFCQYVVAINRLIVIPIYVIVGLLELIYKGNNFFLKSECINGIIFYYFIFASLLKLFIGLTNEVLASRCAFAFIKKNYNTELINLSRRFYLVCFLQQLSFFLLAISVVINIIGYLK